MGSFCVSIGLMVQSFVYNTYIRSTFHFIESIQCGLGLACYHSNI